MLKIEGCILSCNTAEMIKIAEICSGADQGSLCLQAVWALCVGIHGAGAPGGHLSAGWRGVCKEVILQISPEDHFLEPYHQLLGTMAVVDIHSLIAFLLTLLLSTDVLGGLRRGPAKQFASLTHLLWQKSLCHLGQR